MTIKKIIIIILLLLFHFSFLYAENSTMAISKKIKIKKIYPMGKKIFAKRCKQDINLAKYTDIDELTEDIKNKELCKSLRKKQFQALSLYLWEVKRFGDAKKVEEKIILKEDEKCPVCGMFTYKYPRWATQIFYKDNANEYHHSFDGVKDMMKFYFDANAFGDYSHFQKKFITKMLVTDYYSQKAIDARDAYFVIGSDVYGPMGDELIPFDSEAKAKNFYMDHRGIKVIKFSDILEDEVYKLDE